MRKSLLYSSLLSTAFIFFITSNSLALPVTYSASGTAFDLQNQTLSITGHISIDDQVRAGSGNPVIDHISFNDQFYYDFYDYSLSVGNYTFSGNGGNIYMELISGSSPGDNMWSLTGGNPSSQWSDWVGEICDFYNPDGTIQQDPAQYLTLADRILLTGTYYTFQEPELANVSLILTRQNSDPDPSPAPVPEPPAAVLFFAGMICLFPHNKHKPAHKTH